MDKYITEIIKRKNISKEEKLNALRVLLKDIDTATSIIKGELKYCEECNDYFLSESFISKSVIERKKVCIYEDPINSGGNEYEDKDVMCHYSICPKGHKHIINEEIVG